MLPIGRETQVQALGRTWTVGRLEFTTVLEKFIDWVRPQIRNPFADIEGIIDKLPRDLAISMIKEREAKAAELDCLDWESPIVQKYFHSTRGMAKLLQFMLATNHPEITQEQAFMIAAELGPELGAIFSTANGEHPAPKVGAGSSPLPAEPGNVLTGRSSAAG